MVPVEVGVTRIVGGLVGVNTAVTTWVTPLAMVV
jgi:hypothetical protein